MYLHIRTLRLANNWTMEFVANEIGISKQMMCDIESNRRKPSYKVLVKLEDLYQKGHRELFRKSDSLASAKNPHSTDGRQTPRK